jgi:hypothetical protein
MDVLIGIVAAFQLAGLVSIAFQVQRMTRALEEITKALEARK